MSGLVIGTPFLGGHLVCVHITQENRFAFGQVSQRVHHAIHQQYAMSHAQGKCVTFIRDVMHGQRAQTSVRPLRRLLRALIIYAIVWLVVDLNS